jgi:hypothetical protein
MGTIFLGMGYEYGDAMSLWPYIALTTVVVVLIWMVIGYSDPLRSVTIGCHGAMNQVLATTI